MSNSGGAWDNCKKFIKNGFSDDPELRYTKNPKTAEEVKAAPKAKEAHDAAVQGDTVGDPFKDPMLRQDTSGPALNIVMKLQAIVSLVFAAYFAAINHGHSPSVLFRASARTRLLRHCDPLRAKDMTQRSLRSHFLWARQQRGGWPRDVGGLTATLRDFSKMHSQKLPLAKG
eukprot:s8590_g1.t1